MRLNERFVAVLTWPTSRKTAFLYGLLLPLHVIFEYSSYLALHHSGLGHERRFIVFLVAWVIVVAAGFLTGFVVDRLGYEGRWTAYVFVVGYAASVVVLVQLFGTMSSGFLVFIPAIISVWALFYDWSVAKFGVAFLVVAFFVVGLLELTGAITYASVLESRTMDEQASVSWYWLMAPVIVGTVIFALSVCALVIGAQQKQDRELVVAHERLARSMELIRRYIPEQVAEAILSGHGEDVPAPTRRKLTVFFSDVVGFTDLTELLEPEDLSTVLGEYFTEMTAIADRYNATIDDFVGDAIVLLFGAPQVTDDRDHARRAVLMAVEMQQAMPGLNARWLAAGIDVELAVRMGIGTGMATVGNIGSAGRTKYTAMGRSVNLAARLEANCSPGGVLISHATWLLVKDDVLCVPMGEVQLKGITAPVRIYEVVSGTHTEESVTVTS